MAWFLPKKYTIFVIEIVFKSHIYEKQKTEIILRMSSIKIYINSKFQKEFEQIFLKDICIKFLICYLIIEIIIHVPLKK